MTDRSSQRVVINNLADLKAAMATRPQAAPRSPAAAPRPLPAVVVLDEPLSSGVMERLRLRNGPTLAEVRARAEQRVQAAEYAKGMIYDQHHPGRVGRVMDLAAADLELTAADWCALSAMMLAKGLRIAAPEERPGLMAAVAPLAVSTLEDGAIAAAMRGQSGPGGA